MIFRLDVLPAAIADITEAARWYEDQREGLGAEFALAVNKTIETLAEQALPFRVRYRRKNARWTFPRRFPFRICSTTLTDRLRRRSSRNGGPDASAWLGETSGL